MEQSRSQDDDDEIVSVGHICYNQQILEEIKGDEKQFFLFVQNHDEESVRFSSIEEVVEHLTQKHSELIDGRIDLEEASEEPSDTNVTDVSEDASEEEKEEEDEYTYIYEYEEVTETETPQPAPNPIQTLNNVAVIAADKAEKKMVAFADP